MKPRQPKLLNPEQREELELMICRGGVKDILYTLRDICYEADSENPGYGFLNDAALISTIVDYISN